MNQPIYYVYAYIDPRNNKIFYIGKGKNNRDKAHLRKSLLKNKSKKNDLIKDIITDGLLPTIIHLFSNLTHIESLSKEREVIADIGKENLLNLTSGGQGCLGLRFFGRKLSEESKQLLSENHKGELNPMYGNKWHRSKEGQKSFTEKQSGENHHYFGKERSEETKKKIKDKLTGIQLTDEQKKQRKSSVTEIWEKRRRGELPMPNHNK